MADDFLSFVLDAVEVPSGPVVAAVDPVVVDTNSADGFLDFMMSIDGGGAADVHPPQMAPHMAPQMPPPPQMPARKPPPAWHRPGPGRGKKKVHADPLSLEHRMERARAARGKKSLKNSVIAVRDVVADATNLALARGMARCVNVKRDCRGNLLLGGRDGMRFRDGSRAVPRSRSSLGASLRAMRTSQQTINKGRNAKVKYSHEQWVQDAFSDTTVKSAQAADMLCDTHTVRRHCVIVAHIALTAQQLTMDSWADQLVTCKLPTWGVCYTMVDETGQRLRMSGADATSSGTKTNTDQGVWQVMCSKIYFAWGWICPDTGLESRPSQELEVMRLDYNVVIVWDCSIIFF